MELTKIFLFHNTTKLRLLLDFIKLEMKLKQLLKKLLPLLLRKKRLKLKKNQQKLLKFNWNLIQTAIQLSALPIILSGKKRKKLLSTQYLPRKLWMMI